MSLALRVNKNLTFAPESQQVFAVSFIMKFVVLGFALLVCVSIFLRVVSGAMEKEEDDDEQNHPVHAQIREAAAEIHEAHGDHAGAVVCYTKAAEHYYLQAMMLREDGDNKGAVDHFLKAAAMHAAAGNYKMQGLMLGSAVLCYRDMAEEYAGDAEQALAMKRAAAELCETNAKCAADAHIHGLAANAYSQAADSYRDIDDLMKARSMEEAEAEHHAAYARYQAASGDHSGAVHSLCSAAKAYKAAGHPGKARAMNEAIVKLHEALPVGPAAPGEKWPAAHYHDNVARAYKALGQHNKAQSMRQIAAGHYEAMAKELQTLNDKHGAIACYRGAVTMYEKSGDAAKAQSMKDAIAQLEREM